MLTPHVDADLRGTTGIGRGQDAWDAEGTALTRPADIAAPDPSPPIGNASHWCGCGKNRDLIAVVNGKADVVNDHCPASIETDFAECIGMAAAAQAGFRRQGALDGMSTKFEATAVAVACHHARSVS